MIIDRLGRAAAADLLSRTNPDPVTGFRELRRLHARRNVERTVAAALAVLVVLVVTWASTRAEPRVVDPIDHDTRVRNGALVAVTGSGGVQGIGDSGAWADLPVADIMRFRPFAFSADGSEVVYVTTDRHVGAIDVTTGTRRAVADCPDDACMFSLSPDGRRLAFSAPDGLEVRNLTDGTTTTLATGRGTTAYPAWSGDGRRIAFAATDGLYVIGADGSDLRRIVPFNRLRRASGPVSWAPDGHTLAFMRTDGPPRGAENVYTVVTVGVDGAGARELYGAGTCLCLGTPSPVLTWSPDGTLIAFTTVVPGVDDPGNVRPGPAYVIHPDGTGLKEVGSSGIYLAWQPVRRR